MERNKKINTDPPEIIGAEFILPIDGPRYDRNQKTIPVPIVFGVPRFHFAGNRGQFIVKVIAPCEVWEKWGRAWERRGQGFICPPKNA